MYLTLMQHSSLTRTPVLRRVADDGAVPDARPAPLIVEKEHLKLLFRVHFHQPFAARRQPDPVLPQDHQRFGCQTPAHEVAVEGPQAVDLLVDGGRPEAAINQAVTVTGGVKPLHHAHQGLPLVVPAFIFRWQYT